jgi:hypothetical protein
VNSRHDEISLIYTIVPERVLSSCKFPVNSCFQSTKSVIGCRFPESGCV